MERTIAELRQQNAEQRELLTQFSESMRFKLYSSSIAFVFTFLLPGWRNECEKHHEETISAVRSTANQQVPFNVQGVGLKEYTFLFSVVNFVLSLVLG